AMLLLPVLGLLRGRAVAKKFGWRETLRSMFRAPLSWNTWWPTALRRHDDLWSRLPPALRRVRNLASGIAAWFILSAYMLPPILMVDIGALSLRMNFWGWALGVLLWAFGIGVLLDMW